MFPGYIRPDNLQAKKLSVCEENNISPHIKITQNLKTDTFTGSNSLVPDQKKSLFNNTTTNIAGTSDKQENSNLGFG